MNLHGAMLPLTLAALLPLATAAAATDLAAAAPELGTCEAGEECPSDFDSLLQLNLQVQRLSPVVPHATAPAPAPLPPGYFRQALHNVADLQYSGDITLGNQSLRAVFDTGSFELLVFGKGCSTCGTAAKYNYEASETFAPGKLVTIHSFGSGSVRSLDAFDRLEIGNFTVERQAFWEVVSAQMPVLDTASFNAIAGIGPPGQPQRQAAELMEGGKQDQYIASILYRKDDSILMNIGARYVSACLEWGTGTPGYVIWNDTPPQAQPVEFAELQVRSEISWSVHLTTPRFEGNATNGTNASSISLGCANGCEAILDTGTSLIAVPSDTFAHALNALNNLGVDCTDFTKMPTLNFELGGIGYSLPPQTYIGVIEGYVSSDVKSMLSGTTVQPIACQLLLMNSGSLGKDLWILGMPFFRYYYTTFDLGADPYDHRGRRIWTAPAGGNCTPSPADAHMEQIKFATENGAWHVDGKHIRLPVRKWLDMSGADPLLRSNGTDAADYALADEGRSPSRTAAAAGATGTAARAKALAEAGR